jgi:predicted nucleic acid-binding protein
VIVVDASAFLEVLLRMPAAGTVEQRLFGSAEVLNAPYLLDLEIAQVLRRQANAGKLAARRGQIALADLAAAPLDRYPHDILLPRIWELRHNLTAYDAAYVALAEMLDATLITRDRRLAAAPGHQARIEVV